MSVSSAHCKGFLSVQMLEVSLFISAVKHLGKYIIGNAIIGMYNNNISNSYSCSQCLQTNNACGWCIYSKVCSGTATPCNSGTDTFVQVTMCSYNMLSYYWYNIMMIFLSTA